MMQHDLSAQEYELLLQDTSMNEVIVQQIMRTLLDKSTLAIYKSKCNNFNTAKDPNLWIHYVVKEKLCTMFLKELLQDASWHSHLNDVNADGDFASF